MYLCRVTQPSEEGHRIQGIFILSGNTYIEEVEGYSCECFIFRPSVFTMGRNV